MKLNASTRLAATELDVIHLDIPLFIRLLEVAREELKDDASLHVLVEKALAASKQTEVLTMSDYSRIWP